MLREHRIKWRDTKLSGHWRMDDRMKQAYLVDPPSDSHKRLQVRNEDGNAQLRLDRKWNGAEVAK